MQRKMSQNRDKQDALLFFWYCVDDHCWCSSIDTLMLFFSAGVYGSVDERFC